MAENSGYQDPPREELINGETIIISPHPSWNHNCIMSNIAMIFASYLHGKECVPVMGGTDLYLTEKDRFLPDVMVVCDPDKIKRNGVYGAPELVVEVVSPGTAKRDRTYKKDAYARCGVREYWIVNPIDKSVEIYLLEESEFVLHDIYHIYADWELEQMTPEEREEIVTHFKCSLFDDLEIPLEDIFYRTF